MASIPTSKDVVEYLNARFKARGLPYRIEHIAVLPYVNPMWLANWDAPQLADAPEREAIEEELREARPRPLRADSALYRFSRPWSCLLPATLRRLPNTVRRAPLPVRR